MIMDSNLNFKKHIKKVSKSTRASLMIFRNIRHQLPVAAAKLFMHTMILPHLSYCATSWSHTSITTLKPLYTIYKQAVKILAKKPRSYHHCNIIKNYKLLTFDNFLFFADVCLMYKLFHDLAPPPLKQCVTFCKDNIRQTRSSVRGDCSTKFKKTVFGQSAFSVRAAERWNLIPVYIRECATFSIFKTTLKVWLKENQICDH